MDYAMMIPDEAWAATGEMAAVNPLQYRSYYHGSETGFYYLQSRYYDPEIAVSSMRTATPLPARATLATTPLLTAEMIL